MNSVLKTILFVCTGNTCRSTMAEALFKRFAEKEKDLLKNFRVISAGTCAQKGSKASLQAQEVMAERDISIKDHTSKQLTKEMIQEADLILTMTINHKNFVLGLYPEAYNKVYTLKEYIHIDIKNEFYNEIKSLEDRLLGLKPKIPDLDILDPFGQPTDIYRKSAVEIEENLLKLVDKLKKEF